MGANLSQEYMFSTKVDTRKGSSYKQKAAWTGQQLKRFVNTAPSALAPDSISRGSGSGSRFTLLSTNVNIRHMSRLSPTSSRR